MTPHDGSLIDPSEMGEAPVNGTARHWPDIVPIGRDAPPVPFPVEVLPPWIADFVLAESRAVQVPIDMPAVFALGALAAVTGGRLRVRAWEGFVDATNLYTVVAMAPGSIKSPVHRHVTAPIVKVEELLQAAAGPSVERARARRAIAEKRLKRAEDAAARAEGSAVDDALAVVDEAVSALAATPAPTMPRLIVDDATPEQLKSLLAAHGGRLAMLSAESSIFGNVASQRYSKVPNVEAVLAAHSGDDLRVDRRGREEVVRDPRLTICVAVQPAVLREAFGNRVARDRGLFDRFLYSVPPSNVGYRDLRTLPPEVPHDVAARWDLHLRKLANAMIEAGEPIELPLSPAAREAFQHWRAELEPRQRTTGDLACVAGWAAKLSGHVLRLAGLMHVADSSAGPEVSVEALGRALVLAEYFTAHAMIAFDVMGDDESASDARRVINWIQAAGRAEFSQDEVRQGFKGRIAAEPLAAVLMMLVKHGYLRQRREKTGGRPATVYTVRPELLSEEGAFRGNRGNNSDPKIEFSSSLSALTPPQAPHQPDLENATPVTPERVEADDRADFYDE